MAPKGSKKALSQEHEEWVAEMYGGIRSKSSGGHITDSGDVKTGRPTGATAELFECKYRGSLAEPLKSIPTLIRQMEKVADEAWEVGREPVVALRFWLPDSVLAGPDGFVDFSVRLTADDADRSFQLRQARGETCEEDGGRWR